MIRRCFLANSCRSMSTATTGDTLMRLVEISALLAVSIAMLVMPYKLHRDSHLVTKKIAPAPIRKKIVLPPTIDDPELTRILDAIKEILNK